MTLEHYKWLFGAAPLMTEAEADVLQEFRPSVSPMFLAVRRAIHAFKDR